MKLPERTFFHLPSSLKITVFDLKQKQDQEEGTKKEIEVVKEKPTIDSYYENKNLGRESETKVLMRETSQYCKETGVGSRTKIYRIVEGN